MIERIAMQYFDALDKMFKLAGTTRNKVQTSIYNSRVIDRTISRNSIIRIDSMAKIANACGYELCLIPKDDVPLSAIPIEAEQKPDAPKKQPKKQPRKTSRKKKIDHGDLLKPTSPWGNGLTREDFYDERVR